MQPDFKKICYLLSGLTILAGNMLSVSADEITQSYARYHININNAFTEMQVKACFSGDPPGSLRSTSGHAYRYLKDLSNNKAKIGHLNQNKDRINLRGLSDNCFIYAVDLQMAAAQVRVPKVSHRKKKDIVLYTSSWLWLPAGETSTDSIELVFKHPRGYAVSAPWQLIRRADQETVYRRNNTPDDWRSLIAYGKFKVENINVPGATLRLATLNGVSRVRHEHVYNWIEHGARAITQLYGRFPVASPQILVVPVGERGEPVPWGQVLRGGGPAAHLFIDQSRPVSEFYRDWTLIHELSHMLHPYVGSSGSWLAEGLASYYQNVLQARIGTLSERRAWQKLHEGFQRGIKQARTSRTLEQVSRNMSRNHQYMRVYWSGAAISLLADVALRQRGKSLDIAMSELQKCCLITNRPSSAYEVMDKLDSLTETKIFTDLYHQYVYSDEFPDMSQAYQKLGLTTKRNKLIFSNDASSVALRQAIMSPRNSL